MLNASIIIVCWNSGAYLPKSLSALAAQTCQDFEVILVDNGSTDGSTEGIAQAYPDPKIQLEKLDRNHGFAAANNIGARLARGRWLALLNADAFPEPNWLERLIEAARRYPNAFFAFQKFQANDPKILERGEDTCHTSGLMWRRNYYFPVQEERDSEEIFSLYAAAALYLCRSNTAMIFHREDQKWRIDTYAL